MTNTEDDDDAVDSTEVRTSLLHEHPPPAQGAKVSWTSAYILIISRMIGSGIFAAPGVVAESSGSIREALLIWFLGALLAACAAAVSIEYGCMLPQSGGQNLYLEYTYRRPRYLAMSVISVQVLLQTFTANNCIIFGQYLSKAMPFAVGPAWSKVSALTLLLFSASMHGVFLPQGIKVQNVLGFLKMAMIVLIMCMALFVVVRGQAGTKFPHRPRASQEHVVGQSTIWEWKSISRGLLRVFFAYAGIDNANMVLSEVRNPVAMLRCVVPLALVTAFGIYMLVNVAFFLVVPWEVIRSSGELAATEFFESIFGPGWGARICSLLIACCIAGNVMVGVFSLARQNQEIARRSYYPLLFASSRPFHAPLGGVVLNLVPTALIILAVPLSHIYSFLLDVEGYTAQIFASLVAAGLLWLRYTRPHLSRPFKAPLFVVVVYLAVCLSQVISPFTTSTPGSSDWEGQYTLVGFGILTCAFLYWFTWAKLLPRLLQQDLVEISGELDDGTTYTAIRRVHHERS